MLYVLFHFDILSCPLLLSLPFTALLKFRNEVGSVATVILERANILRSRHIYAHRAHVNRVSFLPDDNASSGVIVPRSVYIEGVSMASKEFEIAARSRYLIYRELRDGRKQGARANINLRPPGVLQITPVCRRRASPPVLSRLVRIAANDCRGIRAVRHSPVVNCRVSHFFRPVTF